MKKTLIHFIIIFLSFGCKKTDDIPTPTVAPIIPTSANLVGKKWTVSKLEGTAIISTKYNGVWDQTIKATDWVDGANDVPKLIFISDTLVAEDDTQKYKYKYSIKGSLLFLESLFDIGHTLIFRIEMDENSLFLYHDETFFKDLLKYNNSTINYALWIKQADIKYTYQKN
jgi:hypothetical protein